MDEPGSGGVLHQLESLGVAHGALLLVDLGMVVSVSAVAGFGEKETSAESAGLLTRSCPVTRITIPPPRDGWASSVVTWCLTEANGSDWREDS